MRTWSETFDHMIIIGAIIVQLALLRPHYNPIGNNEIDKTLKLIANLLQLCIAIYLDERWKLARIVQNAILDELKFWRHVPRPCYSFGS